MNKHIPRNIAEGTRSVPVLYAFHGWQNWQNWGNINLYWTCYSALYFA